MRWQFYFLNENRQKKSLNLAQGNATEYEIEEHGATMRATTTGLNMSQNGVICWLIW